MRKVLEVNELSYSYGNIKNNRPILEKVSFNFESGKVYVMLGKSGCGKTTFLSLLGGMEKQTSGSIKFEGKELREIGYNKYRNQYVGFVFQDNNLLEYMNGEQNILSAVEITENEIENPEKIMCKILKDVGISEETAKRNIRKISGGEQQRIAIARALCKSADIILADEPTGNLDEESTEEVLALFKFAAHEENKCVIIVTHSNQVASAADEILQILNGDIVYDNSSNN